MYSPALGSERPSPITVRSAVANPQSRARNRAASRGAWTSSSRITVGAGRLLESGSGMLARGRGRRRRATARSRMRLMKLLARRGDSSAAAIDPQHRPGGRPRGDRRRADRARHREHGDRRRGGGRGRGRLRRRSRAGQRAGAEAHRRLRRRGQPGRGRASRTTSALPDGERDRRPTTPSAGRIEMRPYYEAKADADEFLVESGLDYTIVRPGQAHRRSGHRARSRRPRASTAPDRSPATTSRWCWPRCLGADNTIGKGFDLLSGRHPVAEALAGAVGDNWAADHVPPAHLAVPEARPRATRPSSSRSSCRPRSWSPRARSRCSASTTRSRRRTSSRSSRSPWA